MPVDEDEEKGRKEREDEERDQDEMERKPSHGTESVCEKAEQEIERTDQDTVRVGTTESIWVAKETERERRKKKKKPASNLRPEKSNRRK